MKLRPSAFAALLAAAQMFSGCWFQWSDDDRAVPTPPIYDEDPTPPSIGFTASRGCTPFAAAACPVDARPLMTGVRESVSISLPGNSFGQDPTVTVDDPSVATVGALQRTSGTGERYAGTFDLTGGSAPGATTLRVTNVNGQSWSWAIRVDAAAGMDIIEDEGGVDFDRVQGSLSMRVGQRASLTGVPVSAGVERLYANDGVRWTVPNTRVVNLSWSFMQGATVVDDHIYVEARAPGTVEIAVRAGVVERTVVVNVTR